MKPLTGTLALTRFALRRDRVLTPAWIAAFVLITVASASATMALYPDAASRISAAATINDVPVALAMYGRIWDPESLGALSMFKLTGFGAVMIGIYAIMQIVRHTRSDEERGRTELLLSEPVGSWAPLVSASIAVTTPLVAIAVLCAIGLTAVGLPIAGSWAFGLMWLTTGLAFAGIGAVAAQVSTTGRLANTVAISMLAAAYLVRALGDVLGDSTGPAWWSWVSPLTWAQAIRPFAGDRWWVLVLPLALALLMLSLALLQSGHRDLGAGLVQERAGRASAHATLRSPAFLAWRLSWRGLAGWVIGYLFVSALVGSLVNDLDAMLESAPARAMVMALGGSDRMLDAFISLEFGIIAFVTAAFAVTVVRRLAAEETDGLAEPVLATAVPRTRYLLSYLAIGLVGTVTLTLVQGLAFAIAAALRTGDSDRVAATVGASLAYLPAIWLILAVALTLFALAPRWTSIAWVLIVALVLVTEIGAMLSWPAAVLNLSPFTHIPRLPAAEMSWTPLISLTAIAATLTVVAVERYRRRDLANA